MPWTDSNNPLGAGNEQPRSGQGILNYAVTATTLVKVGNVVALKAYTTTQSTGDWTATPPALPTVVKCPDNAGARIFGVCVGGSTLGRTPVAKGLAMVCLEGIADVLFFASTTQYHSAIINTAHAGLAKDSATPVAGKTLGLILQTKTITTVTAGVLVTCYIHHV